MKKKVMAVDDSIFVIEELKHLLLDTDYEIVAFCRSGEDALELFRTHQPDLVIMDIILPGMDGMDTIKALQKEWPDARVVVVSSLAFDDVIKQSANAGACGFVGKPFQREQILNTFAEALK